MFYSNTPIITDCEALNLVKISIMGYSKSQANPNARPKILHISFNDRLTERGKQIIQRICGNAWTCGNALICEFCQYVFNDISADGKSLHAMVTQISILHKQVQWKSAGCERCKEISADINDDKLTRQISTSTLKKHIKLLHASHQSC